MAPVPPQDDQGLMQLAFTTIMKQLRSGWHRRRKPQFGVPLPADPSVTADPVPSAPRQRIGHQHHRKCTRSRRRGTSAVSPRRSGRAFCRCRHCRVC